MEQQKKEWTESPLDALDGIQRAQMPATLSSRILASIPGRGRKMIVLRQPAIMLAAAGLTLLICFNIYSLNVHKAQRAAPSAIAMQGDNPLADEYFPPAPSI